MASGTYVNSQGDMARAATAEVKGLTVERLKKVLRTENLQVSGVKSELQVRLIAHIERCASTGDYAKIERIRTALRGLTGFANPYPSPYSQHTPTSSLSPQFASPTPRQQPSLPPYSTMPSFAPQRLTFKHSPFYTLIKQLGSLHELKTREQTRDTKKIELRLDYNVLEQLQRDQNTRVMVFCAAENMGRSSEPLDISFPQHGELKCNETEVKHNLKGIKNKTGTTRPADITSHLRRSANFPNSIELVYALTNKIDHAEQTPQLPQKYYLVINMVQKKPIGSLVTELRNRRTPFTMDRVMSEMRSKADDTDIIATSSVMSLKDPLQMTRIQTPVRGVSCSHNACFDAVAFLALQEQAPTWSCPHCSRPAVWESLAFDHYFEDILRNTPSSIDQVTVEPDGHWHQESATPAQGKNNRDGGSSDDDNDDDDDVVEITETRASASQDVPRASSFVRTTPVSGLSVTPTPASVSTPASGPPRSNKRPHSETIDLTLDSDDDEPPITRVKRPSMSSSTSDVYRPLIGQTEQYRFSMPPPAPNPYSTNRYNHNF